MLDGMHELWRSEVLEHVQRLTLRIMFAHLAALSCVCRLSSFFLSVRPQFTGTAGTPEFDFHPTRSQLCWCK